jgi:predicted metal-dependent phosphoesterase TrpH
LGTGNPQPRNPAKNSGAGGRDSKIRIWTVELHTHTCYSPDCLVTPEQLIAACRRKGIDRVAVTDHNVIAGALAAQKIAPDLVIVGEEIKTDCGEIIAYFMSELVPSGLPVREAITRVREQGGVVGVSHPCDRYRREAMRMERLLPIVSWVDALEVFNARCVHPADNACARAIAQEHGKLMFAGSDAHTTGELGRAAVWMPPFDSPQSFLSSLAQAEIHARLSSPLVHFASTYAKLVKRFAGRLTFHT